MDAQTFWTYRYFKQASAWVIWSFLASFLLYGAAVCFFEMPIFEETDSAEKLFLFSVILTYPIFVAITIPTILSKIQLKDRRWKTLRDALLAAATCSIAGNIFVFVLMFDWLSFWEKMCCLVFFGGVVLVLGQMYKKSLGISGRAVFKSILLMCTVSLVVAATTKVFYVLIAEMLELFRTT